MSTQIGEILGFVLQGRKCRVERERGSSTSRALAEFLREKMNGLDRAGRRRKSLQERLGLRGLFGCCGSTWGFSRPSTTVQDDQAEEVGPPELTVVGSTAQISSHRNCAPSMNLAAALAAERLFRAARDSAGPATGRTAPRTPWRVSLMRLLEEEKRDGGDVAERETIEEREGGGSDSVCCVCMGRKKGAAFVPCGHTFCRVCSRELWLNRGSCPLCNGPISQILDIF